MKLERHTVRLEEAGRRLDIFLSQKHPDLSRARIQKLIKSGHVTVNNAKTQAKRSLKEHDEVAVEIIEVEGLSMTPEEISPEPNIIYEENDFIVVEKPAGVVVHPSHTTPHGTLANWLVAMYPEIVNVGENALRPGIVHRLDKQTSGLMIVCKTNAAFIFFKEQFKRRTIAKTYVGLVKGTMSAPNGTITFPIGRDPQNPFKRRASKSPEPLLKDAREAETHWRVQRRYKECTLLELWPKTGRMHQIRVHLSAEGHPIIGDTLYNGPTVDGFSRIFLHASKLAFKGPDGKAHTFASKLPAELEQFLVNLEE